MNLEDLTIELIGFLNETGNYFNFLEYMTDRGYSESEIETAVEKAEEGKLN